MGRKISGLGWQWNKTRYQMWSYFTPLLYSSLAYIIIWTMNWGGFYNKEFVREVSTSFGWKGLPEGVVIFFYIIVTGIFGMVGSSARALGEEIGWRGFLVPELFKRFGYTKTSLITGMIWSVWHYPILLFADYNSGTPAWYGLTCFTVMVISISFIFTWLRLKSGSLWTSVWLHASHNLFIQAIFSPLTRDTGNTNYFIDEFGLTLPIVCMCFAFWFWKRRSSINNNSYQ
jgi:membrane protease YdiL (CAAX protease family)